jgi:restriction system protein
MARRRRRRNSRSGGSNWLLGLFAVALVVLLINGLAVNDPWILVILCMVVGASGFGIMRLRRQQHRRWLARLQTIEDFLMLTPTQFELAMQALLQELGYRNVQHTGGSGDLAADLQCVTPQGQHIVVQCKRYRPGHLVGSPDIQQFIGMATVHHRAQGGIFITTSSYMQPALTLARQHGIELIDGQRLAQLMEQVCQQQQQERSERGVRPRPR